MSAAYQARPQERPSPRASVPAGSLALHRPDPFSVAVPRRQAWLRTSRTRESRDSSALRSSGRRQFSSHMWGPQLLGHGPSRFGPRTAAASAAVTTPAAACSRFISRTAPRLLRRTPLRRSIATTGVANSFRLLSFFSEAEPTAGGTWATWVGPKTAAAPVALTTPSAVHTQIFSRAARRFLQRRPPRWFCATTEVTNSLGCEEGPPELSRHEASSRHTAPRSGAPGLLAHDAR